ncbi:MAG: tetratricopeptide repeat protein, partial [Hyphomicrobiales bacterium]
MAQATEAKAFANESDVDLPLTTADRCAQVQALVNTGQSAEAEALLHQWIAAEPMSGEAHHRLGELQLAANRPGDAYRHFKIAATHFGERADVWFGFGRCLEAMRHFEAAGVAFDRAILIGPVTAELHMAKARIYNSLGQPQESIVAIDAALRLKPGDMDALFLRAYQLQISGDFAGARDGYFDILKRDPGRVDAHFRLADMGEVAGHEDVVVDGLVAAADKPGASDESMAVALFAASSVRRKQSEFDQAFALAERANAISRRKALFDRSELTSLVDRQIKFFDAEIFEVHHGLGKKSEMPVFIVGMPRSGSTLVEQVLSSHPEVAAGGEIGKI